MLLDISRRNLLEKDAAANTTLADRILESLFVVNWPSTSWQETTGRDEMRVARFAIAISTSIVFRGTPAQFSKF